MDNLLFLSHYFGMCELLHWCPPFLWGSWNKKKQCWF